MMSERIIDAIYLILTLLAVLFGIVAACIVAYVLGTSDLSETGLQGHFTSDHSSCKIEHATEDMVSSALEVCEWSALP